MSGGERYTTDGDPAAMKHSVIADAPRLADRTAERLPR